MALPKIGITMGDPTGIGPEIIIKVLSNEEVFQACFPIVFGDSEILSQTIQRLRSDTPLEIIKEVPEEGFRPRKVFVVPVSHLKDDSIRFGKPTKECGEAMARYIEEAVSWVQRGRVDAITTCPINKRAINEAGYPFPGHTEFLAHLTGVPRVAMMFVGSKWKVVLVTTHLPLKEVSKWIKSEFILKTIQMTEEGLKRYFGLSRPNIAVLGLNPHCGEEGLLGEEEEKEILPAIQEANSLGIRVEGPFPADSFFNLSSHSNFDAVISMYHDQGLIPVKMVDFKEVVNLTLGLPFIRTSVGHGTAYEIAGKGVADPTNLLKAVVFASNLSKTNRYF